MVTVEDGPVLCLFLTTAPGAYPPVVAVPSFPSLPAALDTQVHLDKLLTPEHLYLFIILI